MNLADVSLVVMSLPRGCLVLFSPPTAAVDRVSHLLAERQQHIGFKLQSFQQ